ncbi:uncharacterized protein BJ171DRAFT_459226 [Polychytrium aggregatum]|uniref:uncharacterized protein n=1 Tax=Polychytrium aggregatum TaxID=110093 RepID=UPI0022FE846B|nr:uncharacterized protein BJ171DRAFT_459226 [Polychytrium aggregatum]KAI9204645.1 hypothetical protein BJ171DRAFT_459226 [Polychytrium aggregatum]
MGIPPGATAREERHKSISPLPSPARLSIPFCRHPSQQCPPDEPSASRSSTTTKTRTPALPPFVPRHRPWYTQRRSQLLLAFLAALIFLAITPFVLHAHLDSIDHPPTLSSLGLPEEAFEAGLRRCLALDPAQKQIQDRLAEPRASNPRFPADSKPTSPKDGGALVIKNALIWDGDGNVIHNATLALYRGLIQAVNPSTDELHHFVQSLQDDEPVAYLDVEGRYVTPGIVDQHSHIGTDSWPSLWGHSDTNEMSGPTLPQMRSLDSFNSFDDAIGVVHSGGVTTSLVLPGSGNLMGGEAYVFKLRRTPSNNSEEMLINYNMKSGDGKQWRWMKMACGENPKRSYGPRTMPFSRMGEAWLFREKFEAAQKLKDVQDDWCAVASEARRRFGRSAHRVVSSRFPEDLKLESLVALLRGDVGLNVHCYETHDLQMMIRNSHEFGFKIRTFHHATSAWLLGTELAKENISVAIFSDHWAYKTEAYQGSLHAGKILADHGVQVAYKSDHPVLNSQHLLYQAAKGHHFGLPAHLAFAAVTSVPADRLGLGWRIGRLKPGYDADVVVWDRNPLELGAHPLRVYTDGFETFSLDFTPPPSSLEVIKPQMTVRPSSTSCQPQSSHYSLVNIGRLYANESTVLRDAVVVTVDGVITCLGRKNDCKLEGDVYDLKGGVVIPGIIAANVRTGLEEIPSESDTKDGESTGYPFEERSQWLRAVDGLTLGDSKVRTVLRNAGILTAVTAPEAPGVFQGLSVAYRTTTENLVGSVVQEEAAVHARIGNAAKVDGPEGSVTGQIAKLRRVLEKGNNPLERVQSGQLPFLIEAHSASDILRIIALKKAEETKKPEAPAITNWVIVGGAEAWSVAAELAEAQVSVILQPARCTPGQWETRKCRPTGSRPTGPEILKQHQVNFVLASVDMAHELIWEAGWVKGDSTLNLFSDIDAIGLVTWKVADVFGLGNATALNQSVGRIVPGFRNQLIAFNGDPLQLKSEIQIIADGTSLQCFPQQV